MSEMVTRKGPLQCPICFDVQPYRNCARNDCALQSLSQEAVRDEALAIERHFMLLAANRMEIIQNGTCAYMSPLPNGLWVSWALVEKLISDYAALKREPNAAGRAEVESEKSDVSAKPAPAAPDVAKMEEKVWKCKVGGLAELPEGADWPMRVAVSDAFKKVTGKDAQFCFSGWGATLTEPERAVVEKRLPIHGTLPPGASDD